MRRFAFLAALALCSVPVVAAQDAPRRTEQREARKDMRDGAVRPLRDIERRVLKAMPGMEYLGPEYDPVAMAYRLKFIRDGRVVFVDVDARSGQILQQSR